MRETEGLPDGAVDRRWRSQVAAVLFARWAEGRATGVGVVVKTVGVEVVLKRFAVRKKVKRELKKIDRRRVRVRTLRKWKEEGEVGPLEGVMAGAGACHCDRGWLTRDEEKREGQFSRGRSYQCAPRVWDSSGSQTSPSRVIINMMS